ncbi:murein biosynthesis integral membrane protein MurJ [Kitasatospora sp. NPDC048540]|uniref:murein biosynthesis integral membrane protein MurJ n=1 Tax=unclassified Kitasatospora TaxID=2633591 RepID=UPI0007C7F5D7|nr:murein biosynthesis integral membrane protein MurJ [Kitasatospora sp. MBT63]
MTMHTTDGSSDPNAYIDPPTMALRIPAQYSAPVPPMPAAPPGAPSVPPQTAPPAQAPAKPAASAGRNGLIMALGTMASRALGFVRSAMIVAALGVGELGDSFNIANSLPNVVYMMLMGGVLASVFVPELVHAAQTHKDGGVAYTDRLLTICAVALGVLTVAAWFAAPVIADAYSGYPPGVKRDLTITFARYCLPQIFFYGVFTLFGQVLNSRDRFGAMMWTPVLNNLVAIGVFGLYMVVGSNARDVGAVTSADAMLLGLGSTLGIVIQAVGLLPSLRSSGFRWHPRFDWRGAGLGKPLRSAGWALLLVVVTQLSFAVISQLTARAGDLAGKAGLHVGLGNIAYTNAYQLFVVPQGVITISLVTALLPGMTRAATAGQYSRVGSDLSGMLRSSAAMIIPITVLFVVLASQITAIAYGHGKAGPADTWVIAQVLIAFAIGLPAFCAQYALARGFYALGDARTPFWLTVVSTGTNAGLSCVAFWLLDPRWIIIGMATAQTIACLVSVAITGWALGRRLRSAPAAAEPEAAPDATLVLNTRRGKATSGLEGGRVIGLHLAILLACVPGAVAAHWIAGWFGIGLFGNLVGMMAGSAAVLVSLFLFARPLGAGEAVAPLARKLRIPYPAPAPAASGTGTSGRHRR